MTENAWDKIIVITKNAFIVLRKLPCGKSKTAYQGFFNTKRRLLTI